MQQNKVKYMPSVRDELNIKTPIYMEVKGWENTQHGNNNQKFESCCSYNEIRQSNFKTRIIT